MNVNEYEIMFFSIDQSTVYCICRGLDPVHLTKGPFIYYVVTFLGFLDPPPPLRQHVFSTKNNQKLAFSDPPPPTSADVYNI